jgi:hypothetical protein
LLRITPPLVNALAESVVTSHADTTVSKTRHSLENRFVNTRSTPVFMVVASYLILLVLFNRIHPWRQCKINTFRRVGVSDTAAIAGVGRFAGL